MNALAPCLCKHAAVLHKSVSPPLKNNRNRKGFDCLAGPKEYNCMCRKFKLDKDDPIAQLILEMERC